jgi:hypothetical protein
MYSRVDWQSSAGCQDAWTTMGRGQINEDEMQKQSLRLSLRLLSPIYVPGTETKNIFFLTKDRNINHPYTKDCI